MTGWYQVIRLLGAADQDLCCAFRNDSSLAVSEGHAGISLLLKTFKFSKCSVSMKLFVRATGDVRQHASPIHWMDAVRRQVIRARMK